MCLTKLKDAEQEGNIDREALELRGLASNPKDTFARAVFGNNEL